MASLSRRRLLLALAVVVIVVVALALLLLAPGQDLKSRSAAISVAMPREQVEELLGAPALVLPRQARAGARGGRGYLLSWVDQFWQVDVLIGPDGRVESIARKPSDSFYRRTAGRFTSLPE